MSGRKHLDWALPIVGICLALAIAFGLGWLQAGLVAGVTPVQQDAAADAPQHKREQRADSVAARADRRIEQENIAEQSGAQDHDDHAKGAEFEVQRSAMLAAWVSAGIAFVGLGVTGFGLVYIHRTLETSMTASTAALHANRISEETAERQLRAYVYPSTSTVSLRSDGQIVTWSAAISLKNTGATPALVSYRSLTGGLYRPAQGKCRGLDARPYRRTARLVDQRQQAIGPNADIVLVVSGSVSRSEFRRRISIFGESIREPVSFHFSLKYRFIDYLRREWVVAVEMVSEEIDSHPRNGASLTINQVSSSEERV